MILRPPTAYHGRPNITVLPPGTTLWRVHRAQHDASEFRKDAAHPYFGPGRFDAMSPDEFPFLYAAGQRTTALAEVLLRDLPFDQAGDVLLPLASVKGRVLSAVEVTVPLHLVSLVSAADLNAVAQDVRLVNNVGNAQAWSRHWTQWLRQAVPAAQGLAWLSNRDRPHTCYLLFGDRCPYGSLRATESVALDSPAGIRTLTALMAPYRVLVDDLISP